ncbi:SSS family solute:Na+ symporter [Branchiibius hedensis]|uniref:Solute:Na+ symporter, SSS family n=1 Tax=Branchiibius hedensis TaxID=672460 RepID=A0A2Y8ZQM4_9MICO|nr:sodium:solute symporter family protein [Branchiibius hedensis]PWJ25868.1 SSS family solute:Na+ symporter [Branchiibius hedensis]SSA34681.1 solute:Na+ symporter, SSS family [Branchiibius hedensis]
MNAAMVVLIAFFLLALVLGLWSRRGKEMDIEQWSVGGRNFGAIFVFLLLAGEIYTTFTFLGASGYAYTYGGAAFYILGYGALAYVISYWLAPAIWRYAKREKLVSQPDWFRRKYDSRNLSLVVAVIGIVAMVPYLELQLTGLGIIVQETSYGSISRTAAIWIGAIVMAVYVVAAGIHAAAWNAVVKDILVLVVVVFIGIYLPMHYFGGVGTMMQTLHEQKPGFLSANLPSHDMGWFITSILLSALGFFMWPHYFGAIYASRDTRTFRRNAMFLPLYQLVLLFVFFTGLAAVLVVPGLSDGDLSLLAISRKTFSPFVVGLIGAAGIFCALVPGAMLLSTSATLLAKNVVQEFRPGLSGRHTAIVAKALVPVITLIALYLTFAGGDAIVNLLLLGYAFVTQLFPSMVASLHPRNPITKWGAGAGMVVGAVLVTWLTLGKRTAGEVLPFLPESWHHLNVGIVALVANIIVCVVVSLATGGLRVGSIPAAAGAGTPPVGAGTAEGR